MDKLSVDHLLGIKFLKKSDINLIFKTASHFKEIINRPIKKVPTLRDITIANLFFENSTRTKISFELAQKRLGADVVGIDASNRNIEIAKSHAKKNNLNIKYFCSTPETFKSKDDFDIILNMEIVEHVEDVDFFLKSCSKLLRQNGIMFVATLNKTLKSYLFAILGAEYILRWLPIGTHDWEKFIKPDDLTNILMKYDLRLDILKGVKFNIIKDEWSISSDSSVNYIGKFIKN